MPEKTYTEAEIAALLSRAARLQAAGVPSVEEGLTLEEIKIAAAEAGIAPRFVEMASSASSDHAQTYLSIPTGVGRSMIIRGSITDDRWSRMVALFSRELGGPGQMNAQGTRRSWSRGSLRIMVEEANDQIVLHAETEWGKELELPIPLTLVGAIAAATTGALALISLEWTIGVVAALLAILVVGSFAAYRRRMAVKQERLRVAFESVLDRCAAILHEETLADVDADRAERDGDAEQIVLPQEEPTPDVASQGAPRERLRFG